MTNLEGACHAIFGPARQNMAAIFCPHGPNLVAIFGPLDLAIFCPPIIIPLLFVQIYCNFIQTIIAKQLYFAWTKYNCYILSRRLYNAQTFFYLDDYK